MRVTPVFQQKFRKTKTIGVKPLFLVDNFDKLFDVVVSFFKIIVFVQINFVVF